MTDEEWRSLEATAREYWARGMSDCTSAGDSIRLLELLKLVKGDLTMALEQIERELAQ